MLWAIIYLTIIRMKLAAISDLESIKGTLIGSGSEKECFINKLDNTKCIKLGRKDNCKQVKREICYFRYMIETGKIRASFVPRFYQAFETQYFIGYEQECFLDKENGGIYDRAWPLWKWIQTSTIEAKDLIKELNHLKEEMIEFNIICNDLHEGNIFRVEKESKTRMVIIDGYGASEFIPICQYIKFIGRQKIERQWNKFSLRMDRLFK